MIGDDGVTISPCKHKCFGKLVQVKYYGHGITLEIKNVDNFKKLKNIRLGRAESNDQANVTEVVLNK